jgi:hypothetical protein
MLICLSSFLDEHASVMEVEKMSFEDRPMDWMPELHDIPISVVNAYLYQNEDDDGPVKPNGICLLPHQRSALA